MGSLRLTLASPTENFTYQSTDSVVKIGRSQKCEFNIPRDDLSREHCLFEVINDEYFITDTGSKNGITVDRVRIDPNVKTKVSQESLVVLSNIYTLKINSLEIKSKKDMLSAAAKASTASSEVETVTFALDIKEIEEKKPLVPRRSARRRSSTSDTAEAPNYEVIKMAVGFLLVIGFVIYHALGR